MDPVAAVAVLLTVTAVFSWLNHRYIGLPVTIGVMLIVFFFSLARVGLFVLMGFASWWLLDRIGIGISLPYCFLFGALISPTDPIAVVVAGLAIGNHGRLLAMFDVTKKHLDIFWELIDSGKWSTRFSTHFSSC